MITSTLADSLTQCLQECEFRLLPNEINTCIINNCEEFIEQFQQQMLAEMADGTLEDAVRADALTEDRPMALGGTDWARRRTIAGYVLNKMKRLQSRQNSVNDGKY